MNTNKINIKYILSILLIALLFSGCIKKYPSKWGSKLTSEDFVCDKICGKYSSPANLATAKQHYGNPTNPTIEYLIGDLANDSPNYFVISLTDKSELKFELYDKSQKKYKEYVLKKEEEYKCKEDHVYVKGLGDFILGSGISFYYALHLYLGDDGSLIVNSIEKGYTFDTFNIWARFNRVNE